METIGDRLIWYYIPFTDIPMPLGGLNVVTVFSALVVMGFLFILCYAGAQRFARIPGRGQCTLEMYMGVFDTLVTSSLELPERAANRKFFPLIAALFMFLIISNFAGFPPLEYIVEPTGDVNTTLSLGLMGAIIATYCAIKVKGPVTYVEELLGPMWRQEGVPFGAMVAGKMSSLFFFPLNLIGEIAKVVSISFRLFGNITGGGIILVVVLSLAQYLSPLSMGMDLYFVFFVGTVQAFVFTMLTLTYIAVAIK